jgi:hypothetical protein
MKKLIKDQIEDHVDLSVKFFDLMLTKGAMENPVNKEFISNYAKKKKIG